MSFNTVWLPWLAVEQPWSPLARSFLNMLAQMGIKTTHSSCRSTISRPAGIFQAEGTFTGQRALTIQGSLMSACMGVVKVINYLRMCQISFAFQWDTACTYSLTDPSLSVKRVWLVRLHSPAPCTLVVGSEHNAISELIAMF